MTTGSATPSCATSWSRCCSPATRRRRRALAWALYEVGRDPALLARCQDAATDGDDEFLDAVMKESMRLHPIIPMVVRTLMKPATIGGWDLPKGTTVGPSIIIAHHRSDNHEDPETFNPDRFLGHQGSRQPFRAPGSRSAAASAAASVRASR